MEARQRATDAPRLFEAVHPVPRVFSDCKLGAEERPNLIEAGHSALEKAP